MERNLHNRTLALAALFQCLGEVARLAQNGHGDAQVLQVMVGSILTLDAPSLESIYGGIASLRPGLHLLRNQLGAGPEPRDMEMMRHAVAVLYLERRLHNNSQIRDELLRGIHAAQRQSDYFDLTHDNVIAALASLYRETISRLGPRIIVRGDQQHLARENVASRIRVLLLAAIRAAVLWRQAGGSRLRLMFTRRALAEEAKRLLA